jgi:hypothetical protein
MPVPESVEIKKTLQQLFDYVSSDSFHKGLTELHSHAGSDSDPSSVLSQSGAPIPPNATVKYKPNIQICIGVHPVQICISL